MNWHHVIYEKMATSEWKLIYWTGEKPLPGRGEFVRLMFEEAGVAYVDVCREAKSLDPLTSIYKGESPGYPVLAPPYLQHGDFIMNQTPAICEYLGKKLGMFPTGGAEEEAHAMQINLAVCDYFAECNVAYHPLDMSGDYSDQKEEAEKTVKKFCDSRLPWFMTFFEKALKYNGGGEGFFIGDKLTYVDLVVFHSTRATESQFPECWAAQEVPLLKAFKKRMEERPRIAAYLASERCAPFYGHSMM